MTAPARIRLSRARGFRLPETAVNVARPSRWGNPFVVGQHGTRAQCAGMFLSLARGYIDFVSNITPEAQLKLHRHIKRNLGQLRGRDLACWCALDGGACHADILLYLANPGYPVPAWAAGGIELPRARLGMDASDFARLQRAIAKQTKAAP